MKPTVWQRLDVIARSLSPFAISLFLILLGMVPLHLPAISPVLPSLALIAVYYWSVHRPDLMPAWAVFLIGLFQDFLGGGVLGAGTLMLLLVHGIVNAQRRYVANASFLGLWFIFVLVAAAAEVTLWLLTSAYHGLLLDPKPAVFQCLMTIALYPCLAWVFVQLQRAFLSPGQEH